MNVDQNVREHLLHRESLLSPLAVRGSASKGRERPGPEDPTKTLFQEDRDRIVRSNAFRRLKHKTQVFIAPLGDHYLTRLTHTMEVALLARTVVRALGLNEDLAEAICMGHDVGHAPFGHLGEQTLAELHPGGFRHNRQSLRVVDSLENGGAGLNLTWEVRQGILRHSKARSGIEGRPNPDLDTLEAQACKIADALAYINHDVDDAVRAGVIGENDLPEEAVSVLGRTSQERVRTLIRDLIANSWEASGPAAPADEEPPSIKMSAAVSGAANRLREFLFETVYLPESQTAQAERAREVIRLIYRHFTEHSDRVPDDYRFHGDSPERIALDFISGMTDAYALQVAESVSPGVTAGFQAQGARIPLPL